MRNWDYRRMLASVVDIDQYRRGSDSRNGSYEDLWELDDVEIREHYMRFGESEGRIASSQFHREQFLEPLATKTTLEIGPFNKPCINGPAVFYADVIDTAGLKRRAVDLGIDPSTCPEIHYHVPSMRLDKIQNRFDAVVSSHCIEHQPDLIRHLQSVEGLLRSGGSYYVIVPDKRYCFDHFLPESNVAEIVEAYIDERKVHTLRKVIEHRSFGAHNDAARHWAGDHGHCVIEWTSEFIQPALIEFDESDGGYIDVHAWQFTPESFFNAVNILADLGYSKLRPKRLYPTKVNSLEFFAELSVG